MKSIVYMSGTRWDSLPGTDKMLALSLAKSHHVLWVDHPVPFSRYPDVKQNLVQSLRGKTEEVDPHIARLRIPALPGVSKPVVRHSTDIIAKHCINSAITNAALPVAGVINASPIMLFPTHPGGIRLLHVTDDWFAGSALMGFSPAFLRRIFLSNAATADVISAVSPHLADKVSTLSGKPVEVLANGCSPLDMFGSAVRQPVVALLGQLNERLDLNILESVASTGVPLLVIGPRAEGDPVFRSRMDALLARPTVDWRGVMPPDQAAALLQAVSVGITPYADTEFNRSSFPLKTLEYLSAGLPVVATDLPASRWIGSPAITLARTPEQFSSTILDLLQQNLTRARRQDIVDSVRPHSWDARAAQALTLLRRPAAQGQALQGSPQADQFTAPAADNQDGAPDHVFLTRFNLPSAGFESLVRAKDGWLRHRVGLFERFCLPSMRAQTRKNFHWIVYFDPESPEWLKQWIGTVNHDDVFTPLFRDEVPAHELITDIKQVTGARAQTLLTTNLDNDDGLASDFAARVQDVACEAVPTAIYLTTGLVRTDNSVYLRRDPRNAFCSVKAPWSSPTTCWAAWHDRLGENMGTANSGGAAAWLQVIHGDNVSNRVRGRLVDPAPYQQRFPGMLTDIKPVSIRDFILDVLVANSWRMSRELLRAGTKAAVIKILGTAGIDKVKLFLGHGRQEIQRCK